MGKSDVTIKWDFPDLKGRLDDALPRLGKLLASVLQTQRGMIFDSEGKHNGRQGWKPLKHRQGQILSLTGTLRKSVGPTGIPGQAGEGGYVQIKGTLADQEVFLGTQIKYAAIHNFGGTIHHPGTDKGFGPKRYVRRAGGGYRKIGGVRIPPHAIKIPKRPFMDLTELDRLEVQMTLKRAIVRILNGG